MTKNHDTSLISSAIRDFMKLESTAGLLLLVAAIAALLVANSPLAPIYDGLLETTVAVQVGALEINKPLLRWMAGRFRSRPISHLRWLYWAFSVHGCQLRSRSSC